MSNNLSTMLDEWNVATAKLKPGVQRVFHDVFVLASQEKTTLIYGSDYREGHPCLVNTVGTMLTTGGGHGVPSANFGEVVSLFDRINRAFESNDVNDNPGYVSPLAAEVFVANFAPLKEMSLGEQVDNATETERFAQAIPYREPKDEDIARALVEDFMKPAPEGVDPKLHDTQQTLDGEVVHVRHIDPS